MSFDIKKHIMDHASKIIDNLSDKSIGLEHFNTSADIAYFINAGYITQKQVDKVMMKILNNVIEKNMFVKEKNGVYIRKDGSEKQKYRTRPIVFIRLLAAYHNRHFDSSKSVNPHFHFLFSKKERMGKDFMYLMQAIEEEALKFKIKFNFMEEKQKNGLTKGQTQFIKRLSWNLHQGNHVEIKKYFNSKVNIDRNLNTLIRHYKHTENLSFFLKTISIISQRLRELNLDYFYEGVNLKNNIFFFLTDNQKSTINKLQRGEDLDLDLSKVLDREILKHTYGFETEAMNILIEKFEISNMNKNKFTIHNDNMIPRVRGKESKNEFRDLVIEDIRNVISKAKNEKEIKTLLIESGSYNKVITKTQKSKDGKRRKIGFEVLTEKKTKMSILFSELNLNWSKITTILMYNTKKKKQVKRIESRIENYEKILNEKDVNLTKYEYKVRLLLEIYPTKTNENVERVNLEKLAHKFNIYRSEMYGITTYKNETTIIVDDDHKITLKKSDSMKDNVSDMLDIAEIRGWNLLSLEVNGSEEFVKETRKQILERSGGKKKKKISKRRIYTRS